MGLQCAHDQDIVHDDLKPANILIDEAGRMKIGDFGIAQVMVKTHAQQEIVKAHGSPNYMAPELLSSKGRTKITFKVDLWALGCIMHELATQEVTFPGSSKDLEMRIKNKGPAKITPFYSRRFRAIIDSMLQIDAEDRPTTQKLLENDIFNEIKEEIESQATEQDLVDKFCIRTTETLTLSNLPVEISEIHLSSLPVNIIEA